MKVFISADIEGITTTTTFNECDDKNPAYAGHAKQMTEEVLAVIAGAKKAGATEFTVKDAHGGGNNIDPARMPAGTKLLRGWTGHPYSMIDGIDSTYSAAMFVGYHSSAGRMGNPLSHTISGRHVYIKVNGEIASEFSIFSLACSLEGVPTVFLSGDKMLCDDFARLHPKLITCPVKDGAGNMTINYSTADTIKKIEDLAEKAMKQDLTGAGIILPNRFEVEIYYKNHGHAEEVSHYPGVTKKSHNIVTFAHDDYYEVLRTIKWIV